MEGKQNVESKLEKSTRRGDIEFCAPTATATTTIDI